ncbi:MAG: M14 family zinc carboxypeptidase [Bacteroidales bacterium]
MNCTFPWKATYDMLALSIGLYMQNNVIMKFRHKFIAGIFLLILFGLIPAFTVGQINAQLNDMLTGRGEVYFQFENPGEKLIAEISRMVSLDQVEKKFVTAYANEKEFLKFHELGLDFQVLTPPSLLETVTMKEVSDVKGIEEWDFYPTYQGYLNMMYQFQTDYPGLCEIISIGQSIQGRELLFARISSNVSQSAGKPQFMYTATMHGDETAGYVLSLRLIDYLLSNYGADPQVDTLLSSLEIWINPLANPDGTYFGGNNTVNGAKRYNANNVDLNRNYPDPEDGPHPDGNPWQVETIAFMNLAENNQFVMSSNFHGGAEVCNYPWDTWAQLAADDLWWQYVCREYADTAQFYSPPGYMTGFNNGITNGYAWYSISGGRQDYMNYFHQCREFTLELSNTKLPPASQLPAFWQYNYRSFLQYMEQSLFGLNGTVTDVVTGNPVVAEIFMQNHDVDSSWVYTYPANGRYFRPLHAGTYMVTFSAPGYYPQTIQGVQIINRQLTLLDVQLQPGTLIGDFVASATNIPAGSAIDFTDLTWGNPVNWSWTFQGGTPAVSSDQHPSGILYSETGSYDVSLTVSDGTNTETITKSSYITVSIEYFMQTTTVTTCTGLFYDSGGPSANYANNEDYTMIFTPDLPGAMIKAQFTMFDLEYHASCNYDWLRIYDGSSVSAPLIGTYCGTSSPGIIEADNPEGALTFVFHSDQSVTRPGWSAIIACEGGLLPPLADFMANLTLISTGDTVQFTDLSLNSPTSWDWTFEGGTPAFSSAQNPAVTYNSPGTFGVVLTVSNDAGSNTIFKNDYIVVESVTGMVTTSKLLLEIYPNPVSERIFIHSDKVMQEVTLNNLHGQVLRAGNINGVHAEIQVSGLRDGLYLIKVLSDDQTIYRKILVKTYLR